MFRRILSFLICTSFIFTSIVSPSYAQSLMGKDLAPLPAPGTMVALSNPINPPVLRGIKVFTNDPLNFNFILDPGDKGRAAMLSGKIDPVVQASLKETSNRLLKYFLTTLTVPDSEIWVNLSPYEKNRVISEKFGQTEMGRDLLGQDYLLKQITASLMFPQGESGKKFWASIYAQAQKQFGTTQIPVNTFNKVWIMPDKAVIYEKLGNNEATAFVVQSSLKVMLESDYIATQKHAQAVAVGAVQLGTLTAAQKLSRDITRQIIIPMLEKEVNTGANFAPLRQVYSSIILAMWYKERMQGSILSSAYVNRGKVAGVNVADKAAAAKIWQQYVQAYKKGAFNIISEEKDSATSEIIPRKYFAGGFTVNGMPRNIYVLNDRMMGSSIRNTIAGLGVGLAVLMVGCAGSGGGTTTKAPTGVYIGGYKSNIINSFSPLSMSVTDPNTSQTNNYTFNYGASAINVNGQALAFGTPAATAAELSVVQALQDDKQVAGRPSAGFTTPGLAQLTAAQNQILTNGKIPDADKPVFIKANGVADGVVFFPDSQYVAMNFATPIPAVHLEQGVVTLAFIPGPTPILYQVFAGAFAAEGVTDWQNYGQPLLGQLQAVPTSGLTPVESQAIQTAILVVQNASGQANVVATVTPDSTHEVLSNLAAVNSSIEPADGGIDLTRSSTPLDVRNQGGTITFATDTALTTSITTGSGLTAQVFYIYPLKSLPTFLGMNSGEVQQMAA